MAVDSAFINVRLAASGHKTASIACHLYGSFVPLSFTKVLHRQSVQSVSNYKKTVKSFVCKCHVGCGATNLDMSTF